MKHIVIIGAGELGSCIGNLLKKNKKLSIEWWDSDIKKVPDRKELSELIPHADAVLMCVPSWVFRVALQGVRPLLKKHAIIISFAKGIESKTKTTIDRLISEVVPSGQSFVLVSGPMLAEEIELGLPAGAILASKNKKAFDCAASLFEKTPISCCYSSDVHGIAIAGVLKNIYAIALGVIDGLNLGMNARGLIIVRAVGEMARILKALGGSPATALSLAGLGDLIATGSSTHSKNYSVGRQLALSGKCSIESEGKASIDALESMLGSSSKSFHLLQTVKTLLACKKDARAVFMSYFKTCE